MSQTPPPFQAFLDEHHEPVLAFLRGMVGPQEADDCLQETFLAALRAYPRADARNLRAWVLTIARRKAIDHERGRSRRADPVADPAELAGGAIDGRMPGMSERDGEIWTAVGSLPEGQRAAVLLRFAVDLRYRDIGRALGCSEQAARQRVREGLGRLRTEADVGRKERAA